MEGGGPEKRCGILSRGPNRKACFARAFLHPVLGLAPLMNSALMPADQFDPTDSQQQRRRGNREIRRRGASLLGRRRRIQATAQAQSRACALRAGARDARVAHAFSTWVAAADCSPNRWRARARRSPPSTSRRAWWRPRACTRSIRACTIDYRVEAAEALLQSRTPEVRRGHLHGDARARARPGRDGRRCSASWCVPAATCSSPPSTAISNPSRWPSSARNTSRNLVPRGTHEYERLLKPSEIARFARAAGLDVVDIAGLQYDPVREQCSLDARSFGELPHASRAPRRAPP